MEEKTFNFFSLVFSKGVTFNNIVLENLKNTRAYHFGRAIGVKLDLFQINCHLKKIFRSYRFSDASSFSFAFLKT